MSYKAEQVGLDAGSSGLQWLKLGGKLLLYATRATADQLAARHLLSVKLEQAAQPGGVVIMTATASDVNGRSVDDCSACKTTDADGKTLGNDAISLMMKKTATQAKRRAVLSFVGLSCMDETEVDALERAGTQVERLGTPAPQTAAPVAPQPAQIPPASAAAVVKGWLVSLGVKDDKEDLKRVLTNLFRLQPGQKPTPELYAEATEYIQRITHSMGVISRHTLQAALSDYVADSKMGGSAPDFETWALDEYAAVAAYVEQRAKRAEEHNVFEDE